MLEISQVKVTDGSILAGRSKHVDILSEAYIVNCLVMSNQLSLNYALLYVPDGAGSVDTRGPNHIKVLLVPVKACQGSAIVSLLFKFQRLNWLTFESLL
jgi:hypothetical protein